MLTNPASVLSLVWTDYRLALLVAVFIPLTLLIWSWVEKSESISALLKIYWRVAILLAITVYLLIPGWSVGFVTSLLAKILIPLSVWFWADLNEDIRERPKRPINLGFNAWRWAISVYCAISGLIQLLFIRCAFSRAALASEVCQTWRAPALAYKSIFHSGDAGSENLAFWGWLGAVALGLYALYLGYFLFVRLGRQGRSALNQ